MENSRLPGPKIALPRSSTINHVVAKDLKETRSLKAATFVKLPDKHQLPVSSVSIPASSGSPSSPAGHSQYGEALPQTSHSPAGSSPQVGDLSDVQNTYKPVSFHDDYAPATAPIRTETKLQDQPQQE